MKQARFRLVVLIFFLVLVLVAVRLVDLVFVRGDVFLNLALANRFYTQSLTPNRGLILDRNNQVLALNLPNYTWLKTPDKLFSATKSVSRLEALSWLATDSARIKKQTWRYYPLGSTLAQVVGFVRPVSTKDLKARPGLSLNDVVGQMGLEKQFDAKLRGHPGRATWEVDALGRKLRLVDKVDPIDGDSLITTLASNLSQLASQALADKKGAVVILDAATGQVLSLVSSPSFDPNLFTHKFLDPDKEKLRQASVSAWLKSQDKPFFNRAVAGTYPPGSTFKLITALAGLESGKLNPDQTVNDTGVLKVGDFSYANWYYTQYGRTEGPISLVRAIARSNDIYFYKAAEWTGPDTIAQLARNLGLGQKTGIELTGEASGLVPDPAWKAAQTGQKWYLGNTYHFGIGQGDTLVTPLQLAQATQAMVSWGRRCQPHLVNQAKNYCSQLDLDQKNILLVLDGMIQACSPGGTAYPLFQFNRQRLSLLPESASVKEKLNAGVIACKTGTAQFGLSINDEGELATHGWLVAFIDTTNLKLKPSYQDLPKRLVFTVLVESDTTNRFREGSTDAAPVVKHILEGMLETD